MLATSPSTAILATARCSLIHSLTHSADNLLAMGEPTPAREVDAKCCIAQSLDAPPIQRKAAPVFYPWTASLRRCSVKTERDTSSVMIISAEVALLLW